MISKFSMPVNSFIDTASIGTAVSVNRNVITVSPSAIDIGMPVSISAISNAKMMAARRACGKTMMPAFSPRQTIRIRIGARIRINPSGLVLAARSLGGIGRLGMQSRRRDFDAFDLRFVVMRQFAGPVIGPANLQEAEAHQSGAERDRQIDDPHRRFQIVRLLAGLEHLADERAAEHRDHAGKECAAEQAEQDDLLARTRRHPVDQKVHADMDAGANAVGGAEFCHPDEHVDAEFLRPGDVDGGEPQEDVLEGSWAARECRARPSISTDRWRGRCRSGAKRRRRSTRSPPRSTSR